MIVQSGNKSIYNPNIISQGRCTAVWLS